MTKKKAKEEKRLRKLERERAREAARRKARQQSILTAIIVVVIISIGGVLVWISLDRPDEVADDFNDLDFEDMSPDELRELFGEDAGELFDDPDDLEDPDAGDEPGEDDLAAVPGEAEPDPTAEPVTPPVDTDRPIACDGELPDGADAERPAYAGPDVVIDASLDYTVQIATSCGDVTVALFAADAPATVNNFVFLAEEGFYNGLEITRIDPDITVLQTGAPTNTQAGGPGYRFADELGLAAERGYPAGTLAMANSGPDTNGSQFFFVYGDGGANLGPNFTVFGEVIDGLDVLTEIADLPVGGETGQVPQERVYLESLNVEVD